MIDPDIIVVTSDYLIDEVMGWFKIKKGKPFIDKIWYYLQTLPEREFITKYDWSLFVKDVSPLIQDNDDIPHICSYICSDSQYFVTTNRRLAQMQVSDIVNFIDPKAFLEKLNK